MTDALRQTFRQRALAEMGLSPWALRLDSPLLDAGSARPLDEDGADPQPVTSLAVARVPVVPLAALSLFEILPLMQVCSACDRADTRRAVALPSGPAKARLMVIEEVPGNEALTGDRASLPNAQRLLEQLLFSLNVARAQVYSTHLVRCDGEAPSEEQIATCSGYLKREIELIGPFAILAFGPLVEKAVRAIGVNCELVTLPHLNALLGNGGAKKAAWPKLLALKRLLASSED